MPTKKTDNGNLREKLFLRRHFIEKYHRPGPFAVIDACAGSGVIWQTLRRQYDCSYWPLDVKPARGRLAVDSVRVLAQAGWKADIVDIDTYGSPWKHWLAMLPNAPLPLTVFVTIGSVKINGVAFTDLTQQKLAGLSFKTLRLPAALAGKLGDFLVSSCLTSSYDYGIIITEALECPAPGNARYIGLRLEQGKRT